MIRRLKVTQTMSNSGSATKKRAVEGSISFSAPTLPDAAVSRKHTAIKPMSLLPESPRKVFGKNGAAPILEMRKAVRQLRM